MRTGVAGRQSLAEIVAGMLAFANSNVRHGKYISVLGNKISLITS